VPKSLAAGLAPLLAGILLEKSTFAWPLVIGRTLKAAYDLVLLVQFRAVGMVVSTRHKAALENQKMVIRWIASVFLGSV
jgi:hypothetical protein